MADSTNTERGTAVVIGPARPGKIYELPDGERVLVRTDVVRGSNNRHRYKVQAFRLDADGDVEDWGDPCHILWGPFGHDEVIEAMGYTVEARTFDPTRDPFDPREEGWGGWDYFPNMSSHAPTVRRWVHGDAVVDSQSTEHEGRVLDDAITHIDCNGIYSGASLPHNVTVGILLANGYTPEPA